MDSRSGSSNKKKRPQPSFEAALHAEEEEIEQLEEDQEQEAAAQHAHALVHYEGQGSVPVSAAADDGRKQKDSWPEPLTLFLLDLFAQNYIPKRRFMNKEQWSAITELINKRIDNPSLHKNPSQVQGKINSLRKRYRKECARSSSDWPFFQKFQNMSGLSDRKDAAVPSLPHTGYGNHAKDNGHSGNKKRKMISDVGPHDRFGPDAHAAIFLKSMNHAHTERNHNNEHGNSGNPRTWGGPRDTQEPHHFDKTWHPRTFPQQGSYINPWLALATSLDKFRSVYKYVEMRKIDAYTDLVTKLLDRRN